ncbi:MAG: hypothetical protein U0V04_03290 [Spirosomataceae bacterium]|jgi:hypothetical protein
MAKYRYDDDKGKHKMTTKDKGGVYKADKLTFTSPGKHEHRHISVDKNSGRYKEYWGGDNSPQRSYNKKKGGSNSSSGK